jgi:hypothetical protein
MVDTVDRGPYYRMIDKQALARQAQTGESYAVAFTKCNEDPTNKVIVDNLKYEDQARSHDAIFGSRFSAIPIAKKAHYDPLAKAAEVAEHLGPNHAKLHSMAVDHQRAHAGQSYESAYSYLYSKPENVALRNAVKREHMQATMSGYRQGVDKAAPADAIQDDVDPSKRGDNPGSAHAELHVLVDRRMRNEPGISYQQAFTREYLHENNRSLKARVDAESVLHAQRLSPAPAFPAYGHPGDRTYANPNVGRSGAKPSGYAGG